MAIIGLTHPVTAQTSDQKSSLITISVQNVPMKEVFAMIEQQCDYSFIYRNDILDASHLVSLNVTKQTIELENPHFMRGGTYAIDGTKELSLNITYNYACVFCRPEVLGENGIRSIYGKTGAESIPVLQKAIDALTDEVDPDYWKATEGNVKKSLCQLLSMANMRPDGIWDGD